jgi:hypothetical protein
METRESVESGVVEEEERETASKTEAISTEG